MQEQNKKPQTTHGSEQNEETSIVLLIDKGRVKDSILLLKTYEQNPQSSEIKGGNEMTEKIKGLEVDLKLNLEEGAFERKVYQLIHEYNLSYEQVRNVFDLIDTKLLKHIKNTEISKGKRPLDLTRGREN
ncbi:hypothetical protein ACUW90_001908 [Staphylococcus simulans]|uniref:hypothetical protein n=1 Tax=Staphylococcus simulans TaxID=1286 RepID=UPI0030BBB4BE